VFGYKGKGQALPRVKHHFEPGHYYHITSRTLGGVHAFASDADKKMVVDALAFYRRRGDWKLFAFVVMANHVHLILLETGAGLSTVIGNFKKWVSNGASYGPGYRLWERRFDDNAIVHASELREVVQYLHDNPVRIGLVRRPEDYFWSSARNYAGIAPVPMEVDREW
jgi:REP element-mobilizing transposase RayT